MRNYKQEVFIRQGIKAAGSDPSPVREHQQIPDSLFLIVLVIIADDLLHPRHPPIIFPAVPLQSAVINQGFSLKLDRNYEWPQKVVEKSLFRVE